MSTDQQVTDAITALRALRFPTAVPTPKSKYWREAFALVCAVECLPVAQRRWRVIADTDRHPSGHRDGLPDIAHVAWGVQAIHAKTIPGPTRVIDALLAAGALERSAASIHNLQVNRALVGASVIEEWGAVGQQLIRLAHDLQAARVHAKCQEVEGTTQAMLAAVAQAITPPGMPVIDTPDRVPAEHIVDEDFRRTQTRLREHLRTLLIGYRMIASWPLP